jgi:hypothetical protein
MKTNSFKHVMPAALAALFSLAVAARAWPQTGDLWIHADAANRRLAVGAIDEDGAGFDAGTRAFAQPLPAELAIDEPGFQAVGGTTGTLPPGSNPLPGNAALALDFLPMKVGAVTSNLLYWNTIASPGAVAFGLPPTPEYSLTLFLESSEFVAADAAPRLVPGPVIGSTAADGMLHEHAFFVLDDDHDGANAPAAAPGVYLTALRLHTPSLNRSAPFYIVWGAPGASGPSLAMLETARQWVQARAGVLAPDFAADFDGDLDVDAADFLAWQRHVGKAAGARQVEGDADQDGAVTTADLALLRSQFGASLATFAGAAAPAASPLPEPKAPALLLTAAASVALARTFAPRKWPPTLLGSYGLPQARRHPRRRHGDRACDFRSLA